MFHPRNISTVLRGSGGWLAAALLATSAVLIYANLVWAQQTSTEAAVPAPSLTAEADNGTVELNWTAVADAERYELWAWTSADGWQQIGGDSLTDTTYSHSGLTTGTTYYYTVRAVNAAGETGPWSEYVSATFDPPVAAPTLTAQAGEGEVELSWGMVQGAERYELWDWTNADGWQQIGGDNLTSTTYSHTGLTAGTTHFYTVRAVNAAGETGPWSEYVSATVTAGQTPTPTVTPTAMPMISTTPTPTPSATVAAALTAPVLAVQVTAAGTIDLSWSVVADAARYELLTWWNADTGWQKLDDGNLTDTTYSHTGLTAGTRYFYTVRAVNAAGETGPWSEYASATAAAGQTPTPTVTSTVVPMISTTPTPTAISANTDRLALVALYNATDGANWLKSDNWLTDAPLNDWHGVGTDITDRVVFLGLVANQLSGTIPPELGNLSNLRILRLENNQLTGAIPPELGRLSNLTHLWLYDNQLSGTIPPELGNLSNLENLYLDTNQLTGAIPPELGNLSNLKDLVLGQNSVSDNQLTGAIPPELGDLTNLGQLALGGNRLTGAIPPELGRLSNLTFLRLENNQLTGAIPPELGDLTNLEVLNLETNQLSGTIPSELGNLSNLTELWLHYNQLSGTIPPELGNLTNLEVLTLDTNQLSGTIPPELGRLSNLTELWLRDNQLSGTIPTELGDLINLRMVVATQQSVDRNDTGRAGPPIQPDRALATRQPVDWSDPARAGPPLQPGRPAARH